MPGWTSQEERSELSRSDEVSVLLGFAEADFECRASFNSPSMLFFSVIMERWSSPLRGTDLPRKSLPDDVDWREKTRWKTKHAYKMANARVEWPTVRMRNISWDLCGRWLIELTCFVKDKQKNWIFFNTDQFVIFFPAECQSLQQTFQRLRILFEKHLTASAAWVARKKLNSKQKSRKLFIIDVDFGVLSTLGKEAENTAEHVIMKIIFIYAQACVNKDFVHSGLMGLI